MCRLRWLTVLAWRPRLTLLTRLAFTGCGRIAFTWLLALLTVGSLFSRLALFTPLSLFTGRLLLRGLLHGLRRLLQILQSIGHAFANLAGDRRIALAFLLPGLLCETCQLVQLFRCLFASLSGLLQLSLLQLSRRLLAALLRLSGCLLSGLSLSRF